MRRASRGFKGASRGLQGASSGLEKGFKGASRGLEKGCKGASRGLQAGLKGGSSPSHLRPRPPGEGPFKPPLKGTFEGGGSDPAPTLDTHGLNTLIRASCILLKAGGDLACQLAGNQAMSPDARLTTVRPATTWCWAVGLTMTLRGPLEARSSLGPTSSLAGPSSSDRIGRTQ